MIVGIFGKVIEKNPPSLWIKTQSGLVYELLMPISCFSKFEDKVDEVHIHTHLIVREDSWALYGFSNTKVCNLFKMLIKINGVGAKTALAILSSFSMDEFERIAIHKDIPALKQVPGIGVKTAERMMVDIAHFISNLKVDGQKQINKVNHIYQAREALVSLGFSENEAAKLTFSLDETLSVSDLVKQALARKK